MKATFTGTGSAFDEFSPNTSLLVEQFENGRRSSILLDCGFNAPFSFWRLADDPLDLDAVWISHLHGDHYLGLPALMLRMYEEGRTKPLLAAGPEGLEEKAMAAMDLAYPGTRLKFEYPLVFHTARPGQTITLAGFRLEFAPSDHSRPNLCLKISGQGKTLFYSGDGRSTPESLELARGADLIVHESYSLEENTPGHGTVPGSIALAREAGAKRLALVHVSRETLRERMDELKLISSQVKDIDVFLPQAGDRLEI